MRFLGLKSGLAAAVVLAAWHAAAPASLPAQQPAAEKHTAVHVEAADAGETPHPHGAASGEHGHPPGAPLDWKKDLALWSLVVFLLFATVLSKMAWGPLSNALNQREADIKNNIAAAEQARVQAQQMLAEHERRLAKVQDEVREIIVEARRDADHTKQEIVAAAQQEAEATRKRAIVEIGQARDTALKDLFDAMSTQVTSATEHVLGRTVNDDDHNRLVEEALSQFRR